MLPDITGLLDRLPKDSLAFLPELWLCGSIVLLLLLRLFPAFDKTHLGTVAFVLTTCALLVSLAQWTGGYENAPSPEELRQQVSGNQAKQAVQLFGGLLVYDYLTIFVRLFLLGFTL